MSPLLRAFALLTLLAVARVAAAQEPTARVVSGRVLAADGSSVAGVRVAVRGELAADSAQLDSTGAFSLRVPRSWTPPAPFRSGCPASRRGRWS